MISRARRRDIVGALSTLRDRNGDLPLSTVRLVAEAYGVHRRNVLRLMAQIERESHGPAASHRCAHPVGGWS